MVNKQLTKRMLNRHRVVEKKTPIGMIGKEPLILPNTSGVKDMLSKDIGPNALTQLTINRAHLIKEDAVGDLAVRDTADIGYRGLGLSSLSLDGDTALSLSGTGVIAGLYGNRSLRIPQFSTAERNALTAVNGDIVYNTTTTQFELYENGAWVSLAAGGGGVTAGANITDHAIVRGDGGGKGIQDSAITIDDNGHLKLGDSNKIIWSDAGTTYSIYDSTWVRHYIGGTEIWRWTTSTNYLYKNFGMYGKFFSPPTTFPDNDATPRVSNSVCYKETYTNPTTITDFDSSTIGQIFHIMFLSGNVTIQHGTNIHLLSQRDQLFPANTGATFVYDATTGDWYQSGGYSAPQKSKMTAIGGFAIKLENDTGGNTVAGQIVIASTAVADAFVTAALGELQPIGVVLDAGVADGDETWVVVSGIADVLIDNGGTALGDRLITSNNVGFAGSADVNNAPAVAVHFQEIAHCIEARVGAGLARAVLHFL